MISKQINVLTPQIYRMANRINRASKPPPRYQIYCAFSPLNSIGRLMRLFTVYTLVDVQELLSEFFAGIAQYELVNTRSQSVHINLPDQVAIDMIN